MRNKFTPQVQKHLATPLTIFSSYYILSNHITPSYHIVNHIGRHARNINFVILIFKIHDDSYMKLFMPMKNKVQIFRIKILFFIVY